MNDNIDNSNNNVNNSKIKEKSKMNAKLMKMLEKGNGNDGNNGNNDNNINKVSNDITNCSTANNNIDNSERIMKNDDVNSNKNGKKNKKIKDNDNDSNSNSNYSKISNDIESIGDDDNDNKSLLKKKKIIKKNDDNKLLPPSIIVSNNTSSLRNGKKISTKQSDESTIPLAKSNIKSKDDKKEKISVIIKNNDDNRNSDNNDKKKRDIPWIFRSIILFFKKIVYENGKISPTKLGIKIWLAFILFLLIYTALFRQKFSHDVKDISNSSSDKSIDLIGENDEKEDRKMSDDNDFSQLDLSQKLGPKKKKSLDKEEIRKEGCQELECVEDCINKGKPKCLKSKSCKDQRSKLCSHRCRKNRCENHCKDVPKRGYVEQEQAMENCKEKCQKAGGGAAVHNKCISKFLFSIT